MTVRHVFACPPLSCTVLAVDAQNVVQFAGMAAWLWLEGMQLACTLAALYWILGLRVP